MPTPLILPSSAPYRSVSERLSDRCAQLEAAVEQLLHNESVTIAKIAKLEAAVGSALSPTVQDS